MVFIMDKKKIGFDKLIEIIGKDFYEKHKDDACFSYGEEEKGLFCFLGIDLHPQNRKARLSVSIDEWDVYATCYVTNDEIIINECKLPLL